MSLRKSPIRISLISLGCPKNLVDSEVFLGSFAVRGFQITTSAADADAVLINTCAFIRDAEKESLDVISEVARLKEEGRIKRIIVAGCLGEKTGGSLKKRFPAVDFVTGVLNEKNIARAFGYLAQELRGAAATGRRRSGKKAVRNGAPDAKSLMEFPRLPLTPPHYAYLRVAEGCDNRCSYCLIPAFRGRFTSTPFEKLIEEARFFSDNGCKELNVIAQDTTNYGADIYGRRRLAELLRKVGELTTIAWLRILYTHPAHYEDELIREVSRNPRILKYLDLPLQHISDRILHSMGRRVSKDSVRALIEKLRNEIPGLYLRTTFIVGYPGETETEFDELADFVREVRFERMGVFTYSREKGTRAYGLKGRVPEKIREERRHRLMTIQQEIAFENNERLVGKTVEVLVEAATERQDEYVGRFYGDAPAIDNVVFVQGAGLKIGEIVPAVITGTSGYDLEARSAERPAKAKR
jgi:ribosomal protein S12 methylthiotransferase